MKKAIAIVIVLTMAGFSTAAEDKSLDDFARTIATAVFSNDLSAVTNAYLPPNAAWQADAIKSWNVTRAKAENRGVNWKNCTVTDIEVLKLEARKTLRVADVLVNCTDGALKFTLFLDECQERDGRWYLCYMRWRDAKKGGVTTTPSTAP